ncbi:unnamed protein product [Urochloa decumbens]|uniref:PGG domain-containing protein n=1 Tax=Urochloa decumbens TaxID=240449 RepID=A0ABC9G7X1_9POAL
MHPSLLMASSSSDLEVLKALLNWGNAPTPQVVVEVPAADEARRSISIADQPAAAPSAESSLLLEGVTPGGDTALHVLAKSGSSGEGALDCAYVIFSRAQHLMDRPNRMGDTPLHCAVRAGNRAMVSCLVDFVKGSGQDGSEKAKAMLRRQNLSGETALHAAIRAGSEEVVLLLLAEDPELARVPPGEGTSPLYLAVLLRQIRLAQILHEKDSRLSYSGQFGQNALHAAVITGKELTEKVLEWNKDLTTLMDGKGSTPLHIAAALPGGNRKGSVCSQTFEANTTALYQPDNDGLFPIHVAASLGEQGTIAMFLKKCPSSAGLCDTKGRTFLHVAVEKKMMHVVSYACTKGSLTWILNMQDNVGNTALHLAVQAGSLRLFSALLGKQEVNLNLSNAKGQTPLDISLYNIPPGLSYNQDSEVLIYHALKVTGATSGASRRDHFRDSHNDAHGVNSDYNIKELEQMKELTQTLCVGSVLIATVTFGATFALPGGYRSEDHPKGGTPILAGRYSFDAFMIANTLAFIFSSMATVSLMRSGSPMINRLSRRVYISIASFLVETSVSCLVAAFALGVYAVLASVARRTAIAICVMSPFVVVCIKAELWIKWAILARPFFVRMGPIWTTREYTRILVGNLLVGFWPFILIFIWAAYGRDHLSSKLEPPPAQPPAPFT